MTLYYKNLGDVIISESLLQASMNKHFDIHNHSIKELTKDEIVTYEHVIAREQSRYTPSKWLNSSQIKMLRGNLGIFPFEL